MNETMRALAAELRSMPSSEAADWLLEHHPDGGEGITLLEHISLRRADNHRVARHYLAGPTKADSRPYRVFAQRLGLGQLVRVLIEVEGRSPRDNDLLAYHLRPLLSEALDAEERRVAAAFVDSLASS